MPRKKNPDLFPSVLAVADTRSRDSLALVAALGLFIGSDCAHKPSSISDESRQLQG
jgi:hypothetical protein